MVASNSDFVPAKVILNQKVYHCRKLKHKGNAKPTLTGAVRVDGAVDGGSVIIGSHLAKLILK